MDKLIPMPLLFMFLTQISLPVQSCIIYIKELLCLCRHICVAVTQQKTLDCSSPVVCVNLTQGHTQ